MLGALELTHAVVPTSKERERGFKKFGCSLMFALTVDCINVRRISTAYTNTAHATSTGAKQPTHTTRTRGTRCNTLFTPSAAPCAALCAHLLR
jgi:hypothetical protein